MSQKILGIDLGTFSVKVLYLERRVQDLQILEFIEEPLNLSSRVSHEEQVVSTLQKILSDRHFEPDVTSMSLPGHLLASRVLDLPFTNTKRISQLIEFELESFLPFPIEEVFSDFHVLQQEANESQVLCVYTQEKSLAGYMDALVDAEIEPKYFGADFTDLAGIAHVAMVPKDGYYAMLDIGHSSTNLVIMEGSEMRYARAIGIGGYHFTRAIQRAFNLNFEKAEALKISRGKLHIRETDSDQVSRILNKVARELSSLVKQTFLAARRLNSDIHVNSIYYSGGASRMIGLPEFLSFHLRCNVFNLDCLNYMTHGFEDPEEVNTVIPQVLSAAIRPIYSNKMPRINFRKGPYAYTQDLQMITNELKSVGAFVIVIILLGVGYYFYADSFYSDKMVSIDKKIEQVIKKDFREIKVRKGRKNKGGSSRLRSYLKSAKSKLKEFKKSSPAFTKGSDTVVHLMYDISSALPTKKDVNFEVKEFTYSEDFVRLNASTNDTLNVEKIIEALKKSDKFGDIESSDAKPKPGNIWDFTLKIALNKGE